MNFHPKWYPVMGCISVLLILVLWSLSYEISCLAWIFPILIFIAIAYGQFEYFMKYRRCRANCLFQKNSWIYFWMTKKPLIIAYSIFIAIPLTLAIVSFAALATVADILLIILATIITLLLYPVMFRRLQSHVAQGMLIIVTKRFVVMFNMIMMLVIYSLLSYFSIAVPTYLDPSSLENTVDVASQAVGSLCAATNYFLKFVQEVDAIGWYGMLVANQSIKNEQITQLLWILFFINHGLVFVGLSRAQVEVMRGMEQMKDRFDEK